MFNRARAFLATICIAIVAIAAGARDNKPADAHPLKIGIIGAGRIGGTLATLWVKAGHEVLVSSRHPDELQIGGVPARGSPRARLQRHQSSQPCAARRTARGELVGIPIAADDRRRWTSPRVW